jgi:hypothetical protein
MIENKFIRILLHFKKGLYKYSHLVELAKELEVFKKEGISYIMPDGQKKKMKEVRENASKFMFGENMNALRDAIKDEFGFKKLDDNIDIEEEFADDEEVEEIDSENSSDGEET